MSDHPLHIVNIMLSSGSGGIEQAFLDYCEGLKGLGHRVTPITLPEADVNAPLKKMGLRPWHLSNCGEWDLLARWILKRQLRQLKPDVVVAQTNRAFALARHGTKGLCPLVGVAHNYNKRARRYVRADGVFATTHDLIRFVGEQRVAEAKIFHIPNMVRCEALPQRKAPSETPVIGAMGRLVEKKGFDVFIDALQLLKERGFRFKAVLGGTGPEKNALKKRAKAAGLAGMFSFLGWVQDKQKFYTGLDVFCLPSHHEPFGIVLLEAFVFGAPVVSTDSEGPRDIITPNFDALLVPRGSALALADALAQLLTQPELSAKLASNGYVKAKTQYSIESVSERIEQALGQVVARWAAHHP
ncbi:MAG: glycosyltransferase [Rickettsiales bacterium]|nr:glycosyltransferase [Rickettsiales bacterium]